MSQVPTPKTGFWALQVPAASNGASEPPALPPYRRPGKARCNAFASLLAGKPLPSLARPALPDLGVACDGCGSDAPTRKVQVEGIACDLCLECDAAGVVP